MIVTSSGRVFINYRMRQMVFRRIALLISIFICSILFSFFASKILSNAQDTDSVTYYKYYTSIIVYPGDTLTSIAEEYGDHFESVQKYIDEVKFSNNLFDDNITAGMSLIVPYYSTEFK